jgi:hypothetical protein
VWKGSLLTLVILKPPVVAKDQWWYHPGCSDEKDHLWNKVDGVSPYARLDWFWEDVELMQQVMTYGEFWAVEVVDVPGQGNWHDEYQHGQVEEYVPQATPSFGSVLFVDDFYDMCRPCEAGHKLN